MNKPFLAVAFGSDLHLRGSNSERHRKALDFPETADVIILAGDISDGLRAALVPFELADRYPSAHIIWIAGNHEFYNMNIDLQIERFRIACEGHDRVHFLENDSVEISGVKFIGCTLWTDFAILGEPDVGMELAARSINDFVCIQTRGDVAFTPRDAAHRFITSFAYLDEQLAISDPARTVVVTHFPPGLETRNPNFPVDGLTSYFQANVDLLLEDYEPAVWIFGHNHHSSDMQIGGTRVVSSQLGYQSEEGRIPEYQPSKLIYIGAEDDEL
jgi:predicted phosphodiesterase